MSPLGVGVSPASPAVRVFLGSLALALALGVAAPAPSLAVAVLPPGQEAKIGALFGDGDAAGIAGCTFDRAEVAATAIVGVWRCPAGIVALQARRDQDLAAGTASCGRGGGLALVELADAALPAEATRPPPAAAVSALCAAVSLRLQARPVALAWQEVAALVAPADAPAKVGEPPPGAHAPAGASPGGGDFEGVPKAVADAYYATDGLMRTSRGQEILDALGPLARAHRHPLLLGRLVVAAAVIAGQPDGHAAVEALVRAAEAAPEDDIARFVAGVAVHYRGHVGGASRDAKSADYTRAIALLEPLRGRLQSPRLWIYLAVSYHRTGRAADAEAAIAEAMAHDSGTDADVWYCRAEVYHQRKPAQAVADIDKYIEMMRDNRGRGAWSAPEKEQKVQAMRDTMAAVAAGRAPAPAAEDHGLFDPVRVAERTDDSAHLHDVGLIVAFGALLTVIATFVGRGAGAAGVRT